jgi:hypothetical protein
MAVTPVGNPYVESSDLVANYPGASEALAERIDIVGVNPFANAAARNSAIPSPVEGQMASLNDDDKVYRYDGAAWQAIAGGKVLQVLQTVDTTARSTSSTSFVTTSISGVITPSSVSSKILVSVHGAQGWNTGALVFYTIYRGGSDINGTGLSGLYITAESDTASSSLATVAFQYLDAPSTTSALTYTLYWKVNSAYPMYLGRNNSGNATCPTYITLTEISA